MNLESSQGEKKGSELNVNAGFTIIDNNFPKHRDSEDLSEVQFNQNENTGGMGSCLSVVGTSMTIMILVQRPAGKPADHTKLGILKFLNKGEHHLDRVLSLPNLLAY